MSKKKNKKKTLLDKLLYYFVIFILGAITGYIYEVIFYYITLGVLNNWGILYGPWLPIYGVGAVFLSMLKPLKKNPILLFILSIIITGLLEYIVGYISVNIFNQRLWDYTGLFLNINGLVCLRSVLTFAVGSLILNYLLLPLIDKYYNKKYYKYYYRPYQITEITKYFNNPVMRINTGRGKIPIQTVRKKSAFRNNLSLYIAASAVAENFT